MKINVILVLSIIKQYLFEILIYSKTLIVILYNNNIKLEMVFVLTINEKKKNLGKTNTKK